MKFRIDPSESAAGVLERFKAELRAYGILKGSDDSVSTAIVDNSARAAVPDLPLIVSLSLTSLGLTHLVADYAEQQFLPNAVLGVLESFVALLMSWVEQSDQPLSRICMTPAGQHELQLVGWNQTYADDTRRGVAHAAFEDQVKRTPRRTAITYKGTSLTYLELDRRASLLASCLRERGAGPDRIVALCVERSLEMMVGLLGILKSGSAYLPLDPTYPSERLQFMLRDSNAPILCTQSSLLAKFAERPAETILADSEGWQIPDLAVPDDVPSANESNLAYVIYTSGSTGKPKGVMIEHRNLTNFFTGMDRLLNPPSDPGVWLAVTSVSFDISALELLWTLTCGFHVVLQPEEHKLAGSGEFSISEQIVRHNVSYLQCTPSWLRVMLSIPEFPNALAALQVLLVGGEALSASLAASIGFLTEARVFNMYGPTETTIWSTSCPLTGEEEDSISIGRPIANTQVYILDPHLHPVPVGAPGELYIGGAGVARGYLLNQELTVEKFPKDPFRPDSLERMYRTGDRARYRPDGNIEFLGRVDNQTKILGWRVEVEEIEAILLQHPYVRAAAVVPQTPSVGETHLVAFIVAEGAAPAVSPDLRIFVSQKLPSQVVPSAFIFLDALPRTPNGKLDRKSLADRSRTPAPSQVARPGRHEVEALIEGIWREVLGTERVSTSDNFFDLGANSLLMLDVAARISASLARTIPVTDLFRHATISTLAGYLCEQSPVEPLPSPTARANQRRSMLRKSRGIVT
ncbi:MAG: non-ribosomal peptide synthetase [Acidobacteriota bacterium]